MKVFNKDWALAALLLERVKGIEPSPKAWEAFILPLNYTRTVAGFIADWGARATARMGELVTFGKYMHLSEQLHTNALLNLGFFCHSHP